jgi:hypothetical protein
MLKHDRLESPRQHIRIRVVDVLMFPTWRQSVDDNHQTTKHVAIYGVGDTSATEACVMADSKARGDVLGKKNRRLRPYDCAYRSMSGTARFSDDMAW